MLPQFGDQISRHTLNCQRELLCISDAPRHQEDPENNPRINLLPDDFYNCPKDELENQGNFLVCRKNESDKHYYFDQPAEKKARKSQSLVQDSEQEIPSLFSEEDVHPKPSPREYYPHGHFGSNLGYYGFNPEKFVPHLERYECCLSHHQAYMSTGSTSRK